jgi:hypothetical protein
MVRFAQQAAELKWAKEPVEYMSASEARRVMLGGGDGEVEAPRVCLFASYESQPRVSLEVITYCRALAPFFDRVVPLTNEDRGTILNATEIPVAAVVLVPNAWYDMGMHWRVLKHAPLDSVNRLALVNDSCLLVRPLDELFAAAKPSPFWGVADSFEIAHHLQYFFVVFEADALATLRRFVDASDFNAYGPNVDVRAIACRDFEVGISVFMEANGIAPHGVYSPARMLATPAVRDLLPDASRLALGCINPSMMLWDRMLAAGCPIVKKKRYASRHGAASDEEWVGGQKQNIDV